jgi:hypothetical protein
MKKVGLMLSCGLLLGCATSNVTQKSLVSSSSTAPTKPEAQCTSITLFSDPVVIALDDPPNIDIEEYVWGQEGAGPLGLYRNSWKYTPGYEVDATGSGWKRVTHSKVENAISLHPPNVCKPIKIRIPSPAVSVALNPKVGITAHVFTPSPIRRLVYKPIDQTDGNIKFQ